MCTLYVTISKTKALERQRGRLSGEEEPLCDGGDSTCLGAVSILEANTHSRLVSELWAHSVFQL